MDNGIKINLWKVNKKIYKTLFLTDKVEIEEKN